MFHVLLDANQVVRGVSGAGPFADHDALTQIAAATEPAPGQIYDPLRETFADPPLQAEGLMALAGARRDALLDAGFRFEGARFQTRPKDRENIAGAAQMATLAMILLGAKAGDLRWNGGTADFGWIAEDNSLVPMDAQTVIRFGQAAGARHAGIVLAVREIKDRIEAGAITTVAALDAAFAPLT